MFGMVTFKIKD